MTSAMARTEADARPASWIERTFDQLHITRIASNSNGERMVLPAAPYVGSYCVIYVLTGGVQVRQQASVTNLLATDCLIADPATAAGLELSPGAGLLVLRLPWALARPHWALLSATMGRTLSTAHGTANMVANLLNSVAAQIESLTPGNPARLSQSIASMLAMMCADRSHEAARLERISLLDEAKDFIERHLGEADLSPGRIAAAQHVSPRTLHRMFRAEGDTIGGWIRSRRLEQCRVDLADPAFEDEAISHIAARWGIWDAAHFSRLFKTQYGLSPRAYRLANRSTLGRHSACESEPPMSQATVRLSDAMRSSSA